MPSLYLNDVDPKFIAADDALEELHSALSLPRPGISFAEEINRIEVIYREGDESTRYKVLTELIDMHYHAAPELLVEALQKDPSPLVRHEAAFGLGALRQRSCIHALVRAMLHDQNLMVRHEAAIALADIGDETTLGALERATRDECPEVVSSARYALQNVRLRLAGDQG